MTLWTFLFSPWYSIKEGFPLSGRKLEKAVCFEMQTRQEKASENKSAGNPCPTVPGRDPHDPDNGLHL